MHCAQADLPCRAVLRMHLPSLDLATLQASTHGVDRHPQERGGFGDSEPPALLGLCCQPLPSAGA